jgi:hypothetical protein
MNIKKSKPMRIIRKKRPFSFYVLLLLLLFQGISGLYGGGMLVLDPTGNAMHMSVEVLRYTPFNNFLVPGLFLFLLLGVFPLFLSFSMLTSPRWEWLNIFNIYRDQYYVLTYALYTGIMLISWIHVQILLLGYQNILQTIYGFVGLLICIFALAPRVKHYYSLKSSAHSHS